jgi:ribonucleoside-diphosphate reductase alpha chain
MTSCPYKLRREIWEEKVLIFFPAVAIPDLFMKRVEEGAKWTLFDPKEVLDTTWRKLQDSFGEEFEKFYIECENNDKLELKKEVNAKDLFKTFLKVVVETWMPYVFFRDESNRINPNKHAGNVYSTQLCTEIIQNTSPSTFKEETHENWEVNIKYKMGDTVVCNLASLNMAKVNTKEEMEKTIPIAMRILDNVIDLNLFPINEAEATSKQYRSVWLGFLWLAEYLATNNMMYDSKEARNNVDELFENYAYYVLQASNNLSKERWAYNLFDWSDWSKGIIMWKDANWFKENSKQSDKWESLINNIQKDGLRFSYHMSPAPNTSTANVVGTTAWLLPIYKKYFVYTDNVAPSVNVAPKLSLNNTWFYKEYVNMKMPEVIRYDLYNTKMDRSGYQFWMNYKSC